jgi:CBS domain-containing protein
MAATASTILQGKGDRVLTVTAEATIASVVELLAGNRIGAVPVINADREVVGIISERDVVRGLSKSGPAVVDQPVETLMTKDIKTCGLDDTIEELMKMMTSRRIRHLPVVENRKLRGIVSIGDVVKQRLDEAQFEVEALKSYITAS